MRQRCSLLNLGSIGQMSSLLDIKVAIWIPGSSASFLPRVTISCTFVYGLLMSQRCSLSNLGLKGQRSSALGIKVAIWFLGSSALSFLPYWVTTSYIWTTHGSKMSNLGSKHQRSSSLDIKVAIWFSFKILVQLTTPFVRLKW